MLSSLATYDLFHHLILWKVTLCRTRAVPHFLCLFWALVPCHKAQLVSFSGTSQLKPQRKQWNQNHLMTNGSTDGLDLTMLTHKNSKGFNLPWPCSTPWLQAEWNQNHHWCNQARSWKESNEQWNEKLIHLTIFNIYFLKSTKGYKH